MLGSALANNTRPRDFGRTAMDWKEKPSGWFVMSRNFVNEPMPSAVTALAAKKRICRSGDWQSAEAGDVWKNPPWSQPVEHSGPVF
mmetsp:Transcript_23893/g.45884  ORF Transcript_23893/g.45884 Transcript_23893/m.45884 type:complete len:86 (-) Transcript_23893:24-281(-)